MARLMLTHVSQNGTITYEHYCDTLTDRSEILDKYITLGSYCFVLHGTNGVDVYVADSNKTWCLTPTARPNLQIKNVSANGTVVADRGYDGLEQVIVNATNGIEVESLTIEENGTYIAPTGKAYNSVTVVVPAQESLLVVEPLKYLTNSHYYVGGGQEYYYADPIETVASYELEVGAHYIVSLNGSPGPRFRRVMFDNEPFTVIPPNPPASGSGQQVVIQTGVDVGSGSTENPSAYTNFAFEATKRYLGLHLSLTPGDTPTVYLFKIV